MFRVLLSAAIETKGMACEEGNKTFIDLGGQHEEQRAQFNPLSRRHTLNRIYCIQPAIRLNPANHNGEISVTNSIYLVKLNERKIISTT